MILFGKSGFNRGWYESVITRRYLNEYLGLNSEGSAHKITSLINLQNNNYNVYKLNAKLNGYQNHVNKHTNKTRPRHKITLGLDTNLTIFANPISFLNIFKTPLQNTTRAIHTSGFILPKSLNFFNPLSIFNHQLNFSDPKSYTYFKSSFLQTPLHIAYNSKLLLLLNANPENIHINIINNYGLNN